MRVRCFIGFGEWKGEKGKEKREENNVNLKENFRRMIRRK